jgi:hypothetical protein
VHPEEAAIRAIGVQQFVSDPAFEGQNGVERERGVPFRQDEPVALRVSRPVALKDPAIENGENVGDREGRTNVSNSGAL